MSQGWLGLSCVGIKILLIYKKKIYIQMYDICYDQKIVSSVTYDMSVVYNWNIVESDIKHYKPTKPSINLLYQVIDTCS
jgi:hypothetical protein